MQLRLVIFDVISPQGLVNNQINHQTCTTTLIELLLSFLLQNLVFNVTSSN